MATKGKPRYTREHCIRELKKADAAYVAAGKILGIKSLEDEKGIKESDWGWHWTRWNDYRDAADLPPHYGTPAHEKKDLLTAIARLTQELRHYPRRCDLRFKRRADPSFPSYVAFVRRFPDDDDEEGTLTEQLVEHCESHPEFADVLEIVRAEAEKVAKSSTTVAGNRKADVTFGTVYLYQSKSDRLYYLGCTGDIRRRGREHEARLPKKPRWMHTIKTDDPLGVEAYWKRRFAARHDHDSWYELTPDDIAAFRRWRRIH